MMKQSILILEPDTVLGTTYCRYFEHLGFVAAHQKTAESAIQYLDTNKTDLILLELHIANHNGLEFLHELRSYQDWQDIPVIINSFVSPVTLKSTDMPGELGIAQYLYKPETTLEMLGEEVAKVLKKVKS